MKSREIFEEIRSQKDQIFGLRMRLTLFVAAELIVCILISFGAEMLLKNVLTSEWRLPLAIAGLVLGLIICFGITGAISNWFFDPIKQLSKAMERVADGDFSVRLQTKSRLKEIREVYSGFNMMTHELGSIEIIQGDFVSNVSHEFKTPMVSVYGFAKQLKKGGLTKEQEQEYIDIIINESQRLINMSSNILMLSKLENQEIITDKKDFSLDEELRRCVLQLQGQWGEKNQEVIPDLCEITYYGNSEMLKQVWLNVIGNAVKYTPDGGTIEVKLDINPKNEQEVRVRITDNGIGMDKATAERIFEKFYQGDSSHATGGNGLGLAMVKRIVELCGGRIRVKSEPDKGTQFTVYLPIEDKDKEDKKKKSLNAVNTAGLK